MENKEIERVFLLYPCDIKKFLKKRCINYKVIKIEQYYLQAIGNKEIRYRKIGNRYYKTIKIGSGLEREEFEEQVDKKSYKKYRSKRVGQLIKKKRLSVCNKEYIYEFDQFLGYLKGLVYLEVEFDSLDEANSWSLEKKFQRLIVCEITQKESFSNRNLAQYGFIPSIRDDKSKDVKSIAFMPIKDLYKSHLKDLITKAKEYRNMIILGNKNSQTLHKFRVSLREIQMVSNALKEILTDDIRVYIDKEINFFIKETNTIRDLEIFSKKINFYKKSLPNHLLNSLQPFESFIKDKIYQNSNKVVELLKSKKIDRLFESIDNLIKSDEKFGKYLDQATIFMAKRVLEKKIDDIDKKFQNLKLKSKKREFHKIRILFKKLRYTSNLFKPIVKVKYFKKWQKLLSDIQTTLGNHQDLMVQIDYINQFLSKKNLKQDTINALNTIKVGLKEKAYKERKRFFKEYKTFKKMALFDKKC
jgi:CHAD domain-containing protein/CYTH domain-containing protein